MRGWRRWLGRLVSPAGFDLDLGVEGEGAP